MPRRFGAFDVATITWVAGYGCQGDNETNNIEDQPFKPKVFGRSLLVFLILFDNMDSKEKKASPRYIAQRLVSDTCLGNMSQVHVPATSLRYMSQKHASTK